LFSDAFETSNSRIESLRDALRFEVPSFADPGVHLKYVNNDDIEHGNAQYAIIDPDSLPDGTLFPAMEGLGNDRNEWDIQAQFLDHLRTTSRKQLFVVVYTTHGSGLVNETVFQYWIREGDSWKLA